MKKLSQLQGSCFTATGGEDGDAEAAEAAAGAGRGSGGHSEHSVRGDISGSLRISMTTHLVV